MQENQHSIVEVKRGSFTLDPAQRNSKMKQYMTHFDSTVQQLQSSGLNPSWLQPSSGNTSGRNGHSTGVGSLISPRTDNGNFIDQVDWQKALEQTENEEGGWNNVFQQLLRESYNQILNKERMKERYSQPSHITQQVIAALQDKAIKNKATFINKIVDSAPRTGPSSLQTPSNAPRQHMMTGPNYFAGSKRANKPKSQNMTHRSHIVKRLREMPIAPEDRNKGSSMNEPWYAIRSSGGNDSNISKQRHSQNKQLLPAEQALNMLQIRNKKLNRKNPRNALGSFKMRYAAHYLQAGSQRKSVDKGCGSEDEVFSSVTNTICEPTIGEPTVGSLDSNDNSLSQVRLHHMLPSKFKDNSKTNMVSVGEGDYSGKKVMIEVDQKVTSPSNNVKKAVVKQKQFLMERAQLMDKCAIQTETSPMSPFSDKQDALEGNAMFENATTLLNGSEANRDISAAGVESPGIMSSNLRRREFSISKQSQQKSSIKTPKKSAVEAIMQTPFLFSQLKSHVDGKAQRRRLTASVEATSHGYKGGASPLKPRRHPQKLLIGQRLTEAQRHQRIASGANPKDSMPLNGIEYKEADDDEQTSSDAVEYEKKSSIVDEDQVNEQLNGRVIVTSAQDGTLDSEQGIGAGSSVGPNSDLNQVSTKMPTVMTNRCDNVAGANTKSQSLNEDIVYNGNGLGPPDALQLVQQKSGQRNRDSINSNAHRSSYPPQPNYAPNLAPSVFTVIKTNNSQTRSSAENSVSSVKKVIAKSTVFSFNSVPDMYNEESKNVQPPARNTRAYFAASKHNAKLRDDQIKKVQNSNLGCIGEGHPHLSMPASHMQGVIQATAIQAGSSNGDITVSSDDPKISMNMVMGTDAGIQADVGTSPMAMSNYQNTDSNSHIDAVSQQKQQQYYAAQQDSFQNFFQIGSESNIVPIKVTEMAQTFQLGASSNQTADQKTLQQLYNSEDRTQQQTHAILMNSLPLAQQSLQRNQQQDAVGRTLTNAQELHKISEGVFSSELSANSPLQSHLKPNYSQRPATQSKPVRVYPSKKHQNRRMILMENGQIDRRSPNIFSIDSVKYANAQNAGQQQLNGQPQVYVTQQKQLLMHHRSLEMQSPNTGVSFPQQQMTQQALPTHDSQKIDPRLELQNLSNSNVFQLNSMKNDKSMLQVSENSPRTNKEPTFYDDSNQQHLQSTVQAEFIKRIGVTKNGEEIKPSSPISNDRKQKKKSRLDQRIECQQQRIIQPNQYMNTAIRASQGQNPQYFSPESQHNLPAKTSHNLSPAQYMQQQQQPLNYLRLEKYRQRQEQKQTKLPASFIKQKLHHQAYTSGSQKKVCDSSDGHLASSYDEMKSQHQNSQHEEPVIVTHATVNNSNNSVLKLDPNRSAAHTTHDSSIDFDIAELQKFEQLKPNEKLPSPRHARKEEDNFKYAQPLNQQTFTLGIAPKNSKEKAGMESFIPALRSSVGRNALQCQRSSNDHPIFTQHRDTNGSLQVNANSNSPCRQIQFMPFDIRENAVLSDRHTLQLPNGQAKGALYPSMLPPAKRAEMAGTAESLDFLQKRISEHVKGAQAQKSKEKGTSKSNERYQLQGQPQQILQLGRQMNFAKQNRRKQLLSLENRRLCNQEDRVFNERLKMVNAKDDLQNLPRVRKSRIERREVSISRQFETRANMGGSVESIPLQAENAATSTEQHSTQELPSDEKHRQSLIIQNPLTISEEKSMKPTREQQTSAQPLPHKEDAAVQNT